MDYPLPRMDYPLTMIPALPLGALATLDATEEVEIETRGPDGITHRVIIWIVVDGPDLFVRSVHGERGRWYREAVAERTATLIAGDRSIPVRVVPADDPASVERASAGFVRKYADDPSTPLLLRPEVVPATLRLVPV